MTARQAKQHAALACYLLIDGARRSIHLPFYTVTCNEVDKMRIDEAVRDILCGLQAKAGATMDEHFRRVNAELKATAENGEQGREGA